MFSEAAESFKGLHPEAAAQVSWTPGFDPGVGKQLEDSTFRFGV